MFIKGYTVPGVRLDLGLTRDTGGDSSKGWTAQYVMGVIKRIQENQIYKGILFLNGLCCLSQIYQVNPSMTLDFYSYSTLTKLILSS